MNIREIKAPEIWQRRDGESAVFLAGSIEMGAARPWQAELVDLLRAEAYSTTTVAILNPRRDDWDSSWEQSIDNRQFREQVIWELDAIERSDVVALVFDPETKSPITLFELGLLADCDQTVLVMCPPGFWRKGNVDVVCERYKIEQVDDLQTMATLTIASLPYSPGR